MTQFLDVRLNAVGGNLAASVSINQGSFVFAAGKPVVSYSGLALTDLLKAVAGAHVLIGTHGFNVDRDAGVSSLSNWESLLQIPQPFAFVGVLWPGDSVWAHGLDYPDEPRIADGAGQLLAPFIDTYFTEAASISFASHSLGARVVLETVLRMEFPVRHVILMAGAIDDNCLNSSEFKAAAAKATQISVLASKKDEVLSAIFPLGNFLGGILTQGHPWWRAALGHCGPVNPRPANFLGPYELPNAWNYGHHNYLEVDAPPPVAITPPVNVPGAGTPKPAGGQPGWTEAFSAAFASTRFD